ncbi:hypothetical protein FQA39_LY02745 [Lamprigera yunnana]|nr:hypothetical protein FQA39_LY02745 [Lamprigera yunnana]
MLSRSNTSGSIPMGDTTENRLLTKPAARESGVRVAVQWYRSCTDHNSNHFNILTIKLHFAENKTYPSINLEVKVKDYDNFYYYIKDYETNSKM